MKVLNLYAGLGGNRLLWPGQCKVTAVESNPLIAALYKKQFPKDKVLVEDAHEYLRKNFASFDFIWTSRPCQTHSRMNFYQKDKPFPDMALYEELLFLKYFFKGDYVVENVRGYYAPLIWPTLETNRHLIWSSFATGGYESPHFPGFGQNTNERESMVMKLKWMGMKLRYEDFKGIRRPRQIVDNCVHPLLGKHLLSSYLKS